MGEPNLSGLKNGVFPRVSSVDRSEIIGDLWEFYVDSTTSLLTDLEAAAISLESEGSVEEDAADIRRILHSVKGDSGVSGLNDVYSLCHEVEGLFDEMADEPRAAADMILRVKDWISNVIEFIASGEFEEPEFEQSQAESEPGKLRALVVDDDPLCRKRVEMIISPYFHCDFAVTGLEGLQKFERSLGSGNRYDLVTLDINMPELDGHHTLQAIRSLESKNGIEGLDGVKIIMSTSCDESEHVFSAFRQGCEAYVIKREMGEKLPEQMVKLGLLKVTPTYSIR
ncbi:Chemotaxis protein CheY [Anaerohalosphaera lusitana]|uniref:Chemotaxis protein CheY n=1 Tax=Anaerohalosphaera lusitana TaxID=1936003 RepID=A0A1U9NIB5_9BACT|nr:response regulator [Anaerohalosphaera lusitana]AQT67527.1 Chemotaxis protein CheY [Anaerohalosphaera lusitana]